jgi:hypothetical protein
MMVWILYYGFTLICSLVLFFLLVFLYEPLARLLKRNPVWKTIVVCCSLPIIGAVILPLFFEATRRPPGGPGGGYAAGIATTVEAYVGAGGGIVIATILAVGRIVPRSMVIAIITVASVVWMLPGVNMVYACELLLPNSVLEALTGKPYLSPDYRLVHQFFAGVVFLVPATLAAKFIWRIRDARNASRSVN